MPEFDNTVHYNVYIREDGDRMKHIIALLGLYYHINNILVTPRARAPKKLQ